MSTKYVVSCKTLPVFGIFDDYETAQRTAGVWTEDWGVAFTVQGEDYYPTDKPDTWKERVLERIQRGAYE